MSGVIKSAANRKCQERSRQWLIEISEAIKTAAYPTMSAGYQESQNETGQQLIENV
jgi:hypothetical protein